MPGWAWILAQEVSHWATVAPLVACAVMTHRKQTVDPVLWLLAAGLAVSFLADQIALRMALAGQPNTWISLIWAPIQFGLLVAVLTPTRRLRWIALVALAVVALGGVVQSSGGAEVVVQVIGGGMVAGLVLAYPVPGRQPLMLYGLGTVPGLLLFAALPPGSLGWTVGWLAYQAVRVVALLWMVRVVLTPERRREEGIDGPGIHSLTDRRRRADWAARVRRGDAVAQARR
jgi:hypothetical protein